MRLIRESLEPGVARPCILPIDQYGNQDLATILRQAAGELPLRRNPWHQTTKHFRRLAGVRNGDDAKAIWRFGPQPKALGPDSLENRPAHRVASVGICLGEP